MANEADKALLDEIIFAPAQGGRRQPKPQSFEVVRSLDEGDVPLLEDRSVALSEALPTIQSISHAHHRLAQMLCRGVPANQVSFITGYSPAYISRIKSDPMFKELLEHYRTEREEVFIEVAERMKILGLSTLEELSRRLAEEPDSWTKRELMELADLVLVKPTNTSNVGGSVPALGSLNLSVNFVPSSAPAHDGPMLDLEAQKDD